jgi:DNA-binding GntR family transcriptional regulator
VNTSLRSACCDTSYRTEAETVDDNKHRLDDRGLRSVSSGGLRGEVVEILRDAIWHRVLKPGERLNEQALADQLQVSRPPLREAIRVLEMEGLVDSIPRRGAFVRTLDGGDILEIYTARCALEGMAAELVIERASAEAFDELETRLDAIESGESSELPSIISRDLEFHRTLMRHSGNSRLLVLWEQLASQLRLALTLVDPAFFATEYIESTHRPLLNAMRKGDQAETQQHVRELLDVGRSLKNRWDDRDGTLSSESSETSGKSQSRRKR